MTGAQGERGLPTKRVGGHHYGLRWMPTWPHVNLGISAHLDRKYGHLSLHLPFGVLVIGFVGQDAPPRWLSAPCGAEDHIGHECTLERGHDGTHVAHGASGVVASWTDLAP